jgi:hypothetical protein
MQELSTNSRKLQQTPSGRYSSLYRRLSAFLSIIIGNDNALRLPFYRQQTFLI